MVQSEINMGYGNTGRKALKVISYVSIWIETINKIMEDNNNNNIPEIWYS